MSMTSTLQKMYIRAEVNAETIAQLKAERAELLAALKDLTAAIRKARTVRAPAGHYDEDVYYNSIDFYPQMDIADEMIAKVEAANA